VANSAPILSVVTPTPVVFNKGDKITLSVSAQGKAPITYQWYKNKVAIAGATSAIPFKRPADAAMLSSMHRLSRP